MRCRLLYGLRRHWRIEMKNTTSMSPIYRYVTLLFAASLVADSAVAQVVDVSPGSFAGELQCPLKKHSPRSRAHGHTEEVLEPPTGEELAAFPAPDELQAQHVVLGTPSRGDPSRPFSIGLWGDSHTASNYFSEEMMRVLGYSPEKVQPTFIPPTMDRSGVRLPIRKHCQSDGWVYEYAYVARQAGSIFAKGLVNLKTSTPDSYLWVDFRRQQAAPNLRALDILFAPPASGERVLVGIIADDGAERIVELEPAGEGVIRIHSEQAISTIKLRLIEGSLVLQGFVPHYVESPAVYVDTFGIPGATGHGWKALDAGYLKKTDSDRAYDLVILEYGTNEGNDRNFDPGKYESDLRASLQNLRRAYPESLCVLIGPPDRGVLVKRARNRRKRTSASSSADLLKYARIHQRIGSIQEAVGKEYACSYWSWQNAMGGAGAAYRWLRGSPMLMARDLTHLTIAGYQVSAKRFASDINLSGYVENRAE